MMKYMVPALALIFVGACGDDGGKDTGDTGETTTTVGDDDDDTTGGPYTGPTVLDVIEIPGCPTDNTTWVYYAETLGWTDGNNIVNAWEAGAPIGQQWNEEHDLPSIDFGPENAWDALERTLTDGAEFAAYQPNVNTLYDCEVQGTGEANVYAIRVYDIDGNYSDCALFSDGVPNGVADVLAGNVDEPNPVTAPSQINDVDCMEWQVAR